MNIVATIIAAVIVITAVFFSQKGQIKEIVESSIKQQVLSETDTETKTEEEMEEQGEVEQGKEEEGRDVEPTKEPVITRVPTSSIEGKILDYKYPNSQITSSADSSLMLSSTDNPDAITNWYKEKIRASAMNVKTFVTSSANEKILNKLVGADGTKEVRIEISKEKNQANSTISVSITYF